MRTYGELTYVARMRAWVCWVFGIACFWPGMGRAAAGPLTELPTEMVTLPNGLRVLLAPDPAARMVSVDVSAWGLGQPGSLELGAEE